MSTNSSRGGKVIPEDSMKTCGCGGIIPCSLKLDSGWRRVVSFTTLSLYLRGKDPWCPSERRGPGNCLEAVENRKSCRHCKESKPDIWVVGAID